jgi:hypothetical protein
LLKLGTTDDGTHIRCRVFSYQALKTSAKLISRKLDGFLSLRKKFVQCFAGFVLPLTGTGNISYPSEQSILGYFSGWKRYSHHGQEAQ